MTHDKPATARQKAMAAHAALVREERAREQRVLKATTAYFKSCEKVDKLAERLHAAEAERDERVAALTDEGLERAKVAHLLGIEPRAVTEATKRHRERTEDESPSPAEDAASTVVETSGVVSE